MAQFDYQRVRAEVHDYCSMAYDTGTCISSIDDVDPETWEDLIEKFDTGTITAIA